MVRWLLVGVAVAGCSKLPELPDADGDGFTSNVDCNDDDPTVHPTADELCDGIDQDCNGVADEDYAVDAPEWWVDSDGDGYGVVGPSLRTCSRPSAYADNADDCDDADRFVNPGARERCDTVDRDCDGDPVAGSADVVVSIDADSLAEAVAAAADGGSVCVPAGEWVADVALSGKAVTVSGAGVDATTLTGTGRRFAVSDGSRLVVEDLSLGNVRSENGTTVSGAALTLRAVRIDNALVHTGDAETTGPILSVDDGELVLDTFAVTELQVIRTSRATGLIVHATDSEVSVDDVNLDRLDSRTATSGLFRLDNSALTGGGLSLQRSTIGRSGQLSPGGLVSAVGGSSVVLDGVSVSEVDVAWPRGGLFYVAGGSTLSLDHVAVASLATSAGSGALVFNDGGGDVQVDHLGLVGSTTSETRGWVYAKTAGAALTFRNVVSAGNALAGSLRGGWFDCDAALGTTLHVENATFLDAAVSGSGSLANLDGCHLTLVNAHLGPAFAVPADGVLTASGCDGATACGAALDHVTLGFSDSHLRKGGWNDAASYDTIGVVADVTEPGFVATDGDPSTWDLHLLSTSPLVDAGTEAILDADGSRSDVGAYGGPGGEAW